MVLDTSVRRQTYVEDCEVCCNPIEVSYAVDDEGREILGHGNAFAELVDEDLIFIRVADVTGTVFSRMLRQGAYRVDMVITHASATKEFLGNFAFRLVDRLQTNS